MPNVVVWMIRWKGQGPSEWTQGEGSGGVGWGAVREYLYIDQLSELTPWSAVAIRTMTARGVFREGVHYFKPHGAGSRPIFSWQAVVKYIEGGAERKAEGETIPLSDGRVIGLDEATREAQRLLR